MGTQDSTVRLWDTQTSRCVKTYTGHVNRTYSLYAVLAPGGKFIVSGSEDMKVYFWDLQTREIVQVLDGHRGESDFPVSGLSQGLITLRFLADVVIAVAVSGMAMNLTIRC